MGKPDEKTYISAVEAISWIAFGNPEEEIKQHLSKYSLWEGRSLTFAPRNAQKNILRSIEKGTPFPVGNVLNYTLKRAKSEIKQSGKTAREIRADVINYYWDARCIHRKITTAINRLLSLSLQSPERRITWAT